MKSDKYQKRFYREWVKAPDLCHAQIMVQETDMHILTDKPIDENSVEERIRFYRRQIESYIQKDRRFLTSLKPIAVELKAPLIVRTMAAAAQKANVGPMAAVAGVLAQRIGSHLLKKGYEEVVIENGGDIFLKIKKPRVIALYAGKSKFSRKLRVKIKPQDSPLGICTSSSTVGHSLSFGQADAAVIFSKNASLADAVATASANRVKKKKDLSAAISFARTVKGVTAALIIYKNNLASWGKIEFI